ncbi:LuxR C-terminal-related transcriptional regulator [Chryseobacterium jejuense]|uniref:Bacterial regulatory proteins, luxR family n=1 Tax=Chryseobacterium jejuense TaxID=445960 RepID=A0A2X2XQE9_CHRJE|nr:LuxR C-terminal-related transcriptional regulator [Chryseobacterium jejuense]SDJ14686.1 TPR repeat [Chryseobacterium jejuense]SQB28039.1 Bacterial regulatory proteins, luxR family [Chryseobacterium jejuense]
MNFINDIYLKNHRIFISLCIAISLSSCDKKIDIRQIDNTLLTKNEKLRLEGKETELITLNKKIIRQSKEGGYLKGEALGYINLANTYGMMGRYKTSHEYLKSAEKIATRLNDNFLYARLYHEYGQMNYVTGLVNTALNYNAKAIHYGKKLDEKGWLLGNMYEQRADFISSTYKDSALIYRHKGFSLDPSAINASLIGNYHLQETRNLDSATFYNDKALSLLKAPEYGTVREGIIYYFYADLLSEKKEFEKALDFYKKAADILVKTKRINKLPGLYQQIAFVYQNLNNKKMEDAYTSKAEELDQKLKVSGNEAIDLSLSEVIEEKNKDNINLILLSIGALVLIVGIILFLMIRNRKYKKEDNNSGKSSNIAFPSKERISKEDFTELLDLAKSNDLKFIKRFEEINPSLFQNILKINPQLTKSELALCAMIWLGFSSKDIADFTFIQHRSVQTKKGRLRKKLNISSETDLYSFFTSL